MDRLEAMQIFCKVVELGSFAAAAERLDLSTSATSRQLAQLEVHLQARLLNRTTRRISLTEDGRAYYERCLQLLADLDEAEALVGGTTANLRGTLHLTAPISFGVRYMAPAIAEFSRQHPALQFDMNLSDAQIDLVEAGLDMAIRIGELGTQNLVARRIGRARILTCASPAYLQAHGTPQSPQELVQHRCLTYAYAADSHQWHYVDAHGQQEVVRVAGHVHSNNGTLLRELAVAGQGITRAPDFMLQEAVDAGRLTTILPAWSHTAVAIHLAYPSRRHLSPRVRAFADFMQEWLAAKRTPVVG